jgi:hypothetical protein
MIRSVDGLRYVMPFREGGSVPVLMEADDLGLYVVKLRGAAQGQKSLVAELVSGEVGRALGLDVPELVFVELEATLPLSEPDPELALPLEASVGRNLGLDYLPGSVTFDPVASTPPDPAVASRIVLFDALVFNVDRTPRNPNLLVWHGRPWLIDHGASLYVHHGWSPETVLSSASVSFPEIASHVLVPFATEVEAAAEHIRGALTSARIETITADIPEEWLDERDGFANAGDYRAAYATLLRARVDALPSIVEEVARARQL